MKIYENSKVYIKKDSERLLGKRDDTNGRLIPKKPPGVVLSQKVKTKSYYHCRAR